MDKNNKNTTTFLGFIKKNPIKKFQMQHELNIYHLNVYQKIILNTKIIIQQYTGLCIQGVFLLHDFN